MCAYLDDWLIWDLQAHQVLPILAEIKSLGFTINSEKSTLQPATQLIYLGLHIDSGQNHHSNTGLHPTPSPVCRYSP
jgi:hypothetical protein